MERSTRLTTLLVLMLCLVSIQGAAFVVPIPSATPLPAQTPSAIPQPTASPAPSLTPTPLPTPEPTPLSKDEVYVLTFAGDCTLGSEHEKQTSSSGFLRVVGDDYKYPFLYCKPYFEGDDFTLVNLEGTFTDSDNAQEKQFRFKAPASYAKILTAGFVEAVTLTNNHARDYGEEGYADTQAALDAENIAYAGFHEPLLYKTKRGLVIGVYGGHSSGSGVKQIQEGVAYLKENGAQFIVAAFHIGEEGDRFPGSRAQRAAVTAIDAGADMVVAHHPHVLQPAVTYNGKPIIYSLGNFAFGGNARPDDLDAVVARQTVLVHPDGSVELGSTELIPFCISSGGRHNSYQPIPYEEGSEGYARVLEKMYLGEDASIVLTQEELGSVRDGWEED